jgi:hypothetical protein
MQHFNELKKMQELVMSISKIIKKYKIDEKPIE